jgi:hypothetical protein
MIKDWIIGITAASILVSAVIAITPKGAPKRSVRLVGGLILFIVIIDPLKKMDLSDLAFYSMQYRADYEKYEEKLIFQNSSMIETIIEDKTRTYILQKAELLGVKCDVEVSAKKREDGYPYPDKIVFYVMEECDSELIEQLSYVVSSELGVPEEKQEWRSAENED